VVATKYNGILNNLDDVKFLFLKDLMIPVPQSQNINTQRVYIAYGSSYTQLVINEVSVKNTPNITFKSGVLNPNNDPKKSLKDVNPKKVFCSV
jgi:hypothetical protein